MPKLTSPFAFICLILLLVPSAALRAAAAQETGSPPPTGVSQAFANGYQDGYSLGLEDREEGVRPALYHGDRGYEGSLEQLVSGTKDYRAGLAAGYEDGLNSAPNRLVSYHPPVAAVPQPAVPMAPAAQTPGSALPVLPPPAGEVQATPPPAPPATVEGFPSTEFSPNSRAVPDMPLPPYATMPFYSARGLIGALREATVTELDGAFDSGYRLGKPAGKKDARQNLRFDPSGHAEYESATAGSTSAALSYTEHFRNGYLRGYEDGFGGFIYRH